MAHTLTLIRYASLPYGTLGKLLIPGRQSMATLEPPWANNTPSRSCVPAGTYFLELRPSQIMKSTTAGKKNDALYLTSVYQRSSILIHPGNTVDDTKGCILLGLKHGLVNKAPGVMHSVQANLRLLEYHQKRPYTGIKIVWASADKSPIEL